MKRFSYNSRLYRDELEEKEHFKLYKQGKLWVVAGITVFSGGLLANKEGDLVAKADATTTAVPTDDPVATAVKPLTEVKPTSAEAKPASTAAPLSEAAKPASQATDSEAAKPTSQATPQSAASDTKPVSEAVKPTSSATTSAAAKPAQSVAAAVYTKPAATSVASAASKAVDELNSYAAQADSLADQNSTDTIVRDAGVAALALHQKQQASEVSNVLASAASVVSVDSQQANELLASAISIVTSMNDAVSQAGAMVRDDANGVQASVVTKAQAAYEKVSLPDGVKTELDSYGDLVVTTSTSAAYQKVLSSLATAGLMNQFRYVVDPASAEVASIAFNPSTGLNGAPLLTVNPDGSATFDAAAKNDISAASSLNFSFSGNAGDKFWITLPAPTPGVIDLWAVTATGNPQTTNNTDGSVTYTWTVTSAGSTIVQQISIPHTAINPWIHTQKQLIKGGNWFGQPSRPTPDGGIIPIEYGGTSLAAKTATITIRNKKLIDKVSFSTPFPVTNVLSNTDYEYDLNMTYPVSWPTVNAATMIINVPNTFKLNASASLLRSEQFWGSNQVTYTQAAVGQPVVIATTTAGVVRDWVPFIGSFSDDTVGSQNFNLQKFTYSFNGNQEVAPVASDNGAEKKIIPNTSANNGLITYSGPAASFTQTVSKNVIHTLAPIVDPVNPENKLPIGYNDSNVLTRFGVTNSGNGVETNGTLDVQIPKGIDSTGLYIPLFGDALGTWWTEKTNVNVTAKFSDGSSQTFKNLTPGTTLSTQAASGKSAIAMTKLFTVPANSYVTNYIISAVNGWPAASWTRMRGQAGGEFSDSAVTNDNDLLAQDFGVLGYIDAATKDNSQLTVNVVATDDVGTKISRAVSLTAVANPVPSISVVNSSAVQTPGSTFNVSIGPRNLDTLTQVDSINLNANGVFVGDSGNSPTANNGNDMTGFSGVMKRILNPIFYITVPKQTQLVLNSKTGLPFDTNTGSGWTNIKAVPKITRYTNADGLTVYGIDYSGTGVLWNPLNTPLSLTFRIDDNAYSAVQPLTNLDDRTGLSYGSLNNQNVVSASKGGVNGESIALVMYGGQSNAGFGGKTNNGLFLDLKDNSGKATKATNLTAFTTTSWANGNNLSNLLSNSSFSDLLVIQAPQGMILSGSVQGNWVGSAFNASSANNPVPNGTDKHQIRVRLANNTPSNVTNSAGVWNLPQTVTANTDTTSGQYKLLLTGAAQDPTGVTTYYATQSVKLSDDGKSVVLANGHTFFFNSADGTSTTTGTDLVTASAVTNWANIQGIVSVVSNLGAMQTDDVIFNVTDPTSANDRGKSITIPMSFRADKFSSVQGSVKDSFKTIGQITFVDQDGHNINGYLPEVGSFDEYGQSIDPTGAVGDAINNDLQDIPGYIFVKTDGDTVFNVKGTATMVNHYQVNRAQLVTTNKPTGTQVSEIALADPTPNTNSEDPTTVDDIAFTTTDAQLATAGWSYKVVAPDGKSYDTLAAAVTANSTYDDKADSGSTITQKFTVNYTLNNNALTLGNTTKVFDGDVTTNPVDKFTGMLPAGITEPTWVATDFATPDSQNVGAHDITLSTAGLAKLQAANTGKTIATANIAKGTLTITARPITIAAPTLTKTYDGKAYTGADNKITVTGMDGVLTTATQPVYSSTDISKIVNANTTANPSYAITITANAADNGNYTITKTDGSLTINPLPLDPATPNTPTTPTNPKTPNDNPQLQTSVIVQGATKVYDGDATTDPKTFTVLAPAKYTDFVVPALVATDFDKSGITSQNVGNYTVKLTTDGFKKVQDANPNYTITTGDVQDGLFVITPAPITVTGPTLTKVYDGNAYTEADPTKPKAVLSYSDVPDKGVKVVASLADLSTFKNVGPYTLKVTASATDNPNYTITSTDGKLTITAQPLAANVTIKTATKVYDGDAETDPTTFTVEGPTGVTDFDTTGLIASDFDVSGITSQNVGNYTIKLTAAGLAKLQTNNSNYSFTGDKVTNGSFTITQAPVTITAPTLTKSYDGKPYDITADALKAQATITSKPAKGDALNFTLTDISTDINKDTYPITVTAADADNSNYKITKVAGNLMIGVHPLTPATPNTPDTPINPNVPNENPQLETSLVVSGKMKTYDGDKSTDPTTFNVLGPKQYTDFTIPALTDDDFDVSGITSQDVGLYTVKLSASGLKKIQDANTNYDLKAEDVQDGLFNIVKRDISAQGPHLKKVYDGKAYSEPDPKNPKAIITYQGVPELGTTPVVTIDDFSDDISAGGTYVLPITISDKGIDNRNYHIVPTDGSLTITAKPLDPATPNTPDTPINPKTPNDNPQLDTAVVIQGATKVYDGDVATDAKTFTVLKPSKYADLILPTFEASDFDVTGINSQNVGNYTVKLTADGLAKLQAANKNYTLTAEDVQDGLFVITKAPITMTAPTLTKVFDGKAYDDSQNAQPLNVVKVDGVPAKGVTPTKSLTDISKDTNVGIYKMTVTAADTDNPNYTITKTDGSLTISVKPLDPATPNTPTTPVNPKTPNDNPALETALVIQGATKVYDGDVATDPTTYTVLKPSKYPDFVLPELKDSDFDTTGITSQNVGNYTIKLTADGLKKIQDANKNYSLTADDIQDGLFVITRATVTIKAPSGTKVYDGKPFTATELTETVTGQPAKGDAVVYKMADLSSTVNVGTYNDTITLQSGDNLNYVIVPITGTFTITAKPLDPVTPNTPDTPVNPKTPNENPQLETSVVIQGATKVYDGDAATDPTTFTVQKPSKYTDFTIPTFVASDFDVTGITSQDVGNYTVKLSKAGFEKLQAANKNYDFTNEDVQDGLFVITKAPVTITAPSGSKVYDGKPYSNPKFVETVTDKPAKGDKLNYSITDISKIVDKGTYPVVVTASDDANKNYAITKIDGTLAIGVQPLTPATPNTPTNPVDPKTPHDNPALETSVVVQGATKVYDGDVATDPTTFTVLAPSKYNDFVVPALTKDDFDLSGITSQNVGRYIVTLNESGLHKVQLANTNYQITAEDIQNGLFVITPAPVSITAPSGSKVYDGKPYTDDTFTETVTGVPAKGTKLDYTITDTAKDINVGSYDVKVTTPTGGNGNYSLTTKDGKLTITAQPLDPATPNTPTTPINPKTPNENPQLDASVVVKGATKVYDGDVTTDPTMFTVLAPSKFTDFSIPTFEASDFDVTGINSQNVGNYTVKLSSTGLEKLQAANKNYDFTAADVQDGLFVITKAPVTITAPSGHKAYDGKPYSDPKFVATTSTVPAKGDKLVYTITDMSKDIDKGTYPVEVLTNDSDNGNYDITKVAGSLVIGALPLDPVTPNTPTTPVNPKTPNENPQLETSVVVQGATKVYDGDVTKDPTTFTVLAPSKYADFVMPTFADSDFDVSGITSQNVGNYTVKLTADGLQKLQEANKNYTLTADDVQDGLFVITKAPITLTAPTLTKVFDGKPYAEADPQHPLNVLTHAGVPTKGVAVVASLTDISKDFHAAKYVIDVVADDTANENYSITKVAGSLTISPRPLTPATPNTPDKPINPDNPSNNPQLVGSMVIQGATKVYDGDVASDPTTYKVLVPTKYNDFIIPTLVAKDFNLDGINSQNVGNYPVRLSQIGIDDIKAANPDYTFNANDIQDALFVITKAPVTITAPSASKSYDGKPYVNASFVGTHTELPAKGDALIYTITDISKDVDKGTYPVEVLTTDSDNGNYNITKVAGTLTIGAQPLTPATPNTPTTPVNPKTPNDNSQLETSVVVQGATKVYDGDVTTDPKTFTVLAPSKYADFVMPTFADSDFDVTGINSQNVGNYTVKLTAAGLQKLQGANKNYTLTADDVQDGLFVITKAPITLTAPTLKKVFDGKPYTEADAEHPLNVITPSDVPAKGVTPVASLTDISKDFHAGTYTIDITADDTANANYTITKVAGSLTISPRPLIPATPNTPGQPANPDNPSNNPQLVSSMVIFGATKVYDGDKATDPTTYEVKAPSKYGDFIIPTLEADAFNLDGITSQNVGKYPVRLSQKGIDAIKTANPDYSFNANDIQDALFVITKAPVTITAPSATKQYDGKPYVNADFVGTNTPLPTKGDALVYTITDISKDVNKGTYPVEVLTNDSDNGNYEISKVAGTLKIGAQPLDPATPNTPDKPVDPKTPNENPQLETSVVVQGATKVYDGDVTTDPTTFTVLAPSKYADFVMPTFAANDFDVTGITSQNVGNYTVKLNAAGFAKLQAANQNYDLTAEDVQDGLFVITKAPITLTGPTVTKVFDGKPFTDTDALVVAPTDVPTKGVAPVANLADISKDFHAGKYAIDVIADENANSNYTITTVAGSLTITPRPLNPATPNTPDQPANPDNPSDNPQLLNSLVIQGATKVYNGDKTTDPTTYKVTAPSKYADFIIPSLSAADFNLDGITSQNVGNYPVRLSQAGIDRIKTANPDYTFNAGDIQDALFVITKAPVTITAPQLAKTYDGKAYDGIVRAQNSILPAKGEALVYKLTDISKFTDQGSYTIDVLTAPSDNLNYQITDVPGQLVISRHGLVPVDPNTPNKPVNPITPNKNPQLDASVVVSGATKVYDGDATTDPTTFTVMAPKNYSDFVLPTFTKADFTTEITSQDVGNYTVKLNETGLAKLQAANKNYDVKGKDVQDGLFVITKAPLTLTAPTLTKVYDGLPYQDKTKEVVLIGGRPAKGVAPVATLSDISALYHAGQYDINVLATAANNKNYQLKLINGTLTITAKPLTPAEPNKPGKPVNPTTPDKNPQLEASVVVEGATKVYDGDKATDPTTFTVLAPKADRDFMIPQLTASDFVTEITSQNVGNYTVKLSATGLAKLQAANRDYDLKEADVQDGLFVITKAPVTVTAGSVTKTYDGKPYADKISTSVTGQPKLGDAVVYTLSDLSSFINKGTYAVNVMTKATDNGNYVVTTAPGSLTITAKGLTPVVPNKPGKPVNPTTPDKNPQLETSVVVQGATKLYDGDSATDPTVYTVLAPSKYPDFVVPTLTKDDFDTTGITSQNVGQYAVTLSTSGLAKLQAANKNYDFTAADVQNGLFIINPAPVTITAPSGSKAYDGQPYPSAKLVANEQGVPAKGDKLQYTLTDVSHDINKGTYPVEVLIKTSANLNYVVKTVAGTVTITAKGLTPVTPNKPGKPVNPTTPTKNPQLETSVVVQGATKVYDGDKLTDPTTFTVLAPSKYPDFVVPELTQTDFDTTGITSQNVGQYAVTLSKTGLAKLQAANKNYDFTSEDVQNGLFVITPATITIAAPTLTKTFDGQPYAGSRQATLTGIPAKGTQPVYTMTDISQDSAIGTYPITIAANETANSNYVVKTANGQLTITGDQYSLIANYVDGAGKTVAPSETKADLNFDDDYITTAKVVSGYVLVKTPTNAKGVMPKGNVTVTYVYDKVGNYVVTPPTGGKTTTPYTNDPHNPGKVVTPSTPIIPGVPGYTPNDPNGKPLIPVDPKNPNKGYFPPTPGNPTTDTHITYTADKQTVVVLLVDSKGQAVVNAAGQSSYTLTGKSDTDVDFSTVNKLVNGYVVASDGTAQAMKFDHDDNVNQTVQVVYDKVGNYVVTPPTGGNKTITPYPNDPNNPGKVVTPNTPLVPNVPGFTPHDPSGKPLVPVDPNDPNKGYLPPTVPSDPTIDTHITYTADDQTVIVKLVDVSGKSVTNTAGVVGYSISGKTGANVDFTQVNKLVPGYVLKTDGTLAGLKFDNDDKTNQVVTITYNMVGNYIITPPTGGQTKTPYPNDPHDPAKIVTPTTLVVPNVPGFTPYGPDGKPLKPIDPNDPNKGYLPPEVPSDPTIDTHITYVPNPKKPVTPVTPPVNPGTPTTPVVPGKPVTPADTKQPHVPANTPVEINTPVVTPDVGQPQRLMTINRHGKSTPVAKAVAQTLPETGEQDSLSIAIAGLGMMISGLAFLGLRRKKHEAD